MQHNTDPVSICWCGGAGCQVSESSHPWGLTTDHRRLWWEPCPAAKAKAAHSLVPASQQPCPAQFLHGETQRGEGGRHHLSLERSVGPRPVVTLLAACPVAEAQPSLRGGPCAENQGTARQPPGARAARGWDLCWEQRSTESSQLLHSSCGVLCPCSTSTWLTEGHKLVQNPLCQAEQHLHISH